MDITQERQIGQDVLGFVNAVQWDARTPIQLLGTGSQQAQKYPSDIDLFSGIKETAPSDIRQIYNHMNTVFENADALGDMYFIEFKLQNLDGSKQKWFNTDLTESDLANAVPTGATIDFVKVDYVIFIRDRNLFTELSSIYSFSRMPPVQQLIGKIKTDFYGYFKDGNYYKSLKRMYSIYKLQGKKDKLVELSTLFNSNTGYKYSISSNLKAIKLLLEHYSGQGSIANAVRVNLSDIGNILDEKITTEKKMDEIISALDAQIQTETEEWLNTHSSVLPPDVRLTGGVNAPFGRMGGKRKLASRLIAMFPKDYKTYVEPFVGAGNIFFRVPKREGVKYVINDKDPSIYKIMKALRDRGDKINKQIDRGVPSREKFHAIKHKKNRTAEEEIMLTKHSYFSSRKSYNPQGASIKTDYSKHHEELKGVTVLNEDFAKVIRSYNTPTTFFYLDPPYESKEMKDYADYVTPDQVLSAVKSIKGKFMLSYNDSPNIRRVFSQYNVKGITTTYAPTTFSPARVAHEVVITNY